MNIYFLGHSEIIIEIQNPKGKTFRILNDSWLSSHAFGDFMQRNPIWNFENHFLPKIDYIFISHPHCDHLDPYSLLWLYQFQKPRMILPENLLYLKNIIQKYLNAEIITLKNFETISIEGINFTGVIFHQNYITNERDVMTLFIENENEIAFLEQDCAIPENYNSYHFIYEKFKRKNIENRLYICVRNELEGFYLATDEGNSKKRNQKINHYKQKRYNEIKWEYYKFQEVNLPNFYKLPYFAKIYTGQGMIYPIVFFNMLQDISSPFSLDEIINKEKILLKKFNYKNLQLYKQIPGYYYKIEKGKLKESGKFSNSLTYFPTNFTTKEFVKEVKDIPVIDEKRDIEYQKTLVENLLKRLFYFLTSNPEIQITNLMKENYTIQIRYGSSKDYKNINYFINFYNYGFAETNNNSLKPSEIYWANDIEDFYNGKLDQFSSVLLNLENFLTFHFWTMLGIPYLNNDIVRNKIEYHFKNAIKQKIEDYILPIIKNKIFIKEI